MEPYASATILYDAFGTILSSGNDYLQIDFESIADEGLVHNFPTYYYCVAPNGNLVASISNIQTTASVQSGQSLVQFNVVNTGGGVAENTQLSIPNVDWLQSVTPTNIGDLAPGDTATVILRFLANASLPLSYPVNGSIAMNTSNSNSLSIPFSFEKVTTSSGGVVIEVVDQYTYFTEEAPKVENALVTISNYYTGQVYASGLTNSDGLFSSEEVPEGTHRIRVSKDQHLAYESTMVINPGIENYKNVYIQYQAITYTWSVIPTSIQDEYTIDLIATFETNVPTPVVIINMPSQLPALMADETFAFNVTLTNYGLIAAQNTQLTLPEDIEYEFIYDYPNGSELLALQSIQVPVLMIRRDTIGLNLNFSAGLMVDDVSSMLNIATIPQAFAGAQLPCNDIAGFSFSFSCGGSDNLSAAASLFSYEGRDCTIEDGPEVICADCGTGPSGGGGGGGGSGPPCYGCSWDTAPIESGSSSAPILVLNNLSCNEAIDHILGIMGSCLGGPLALAASAISFPGDVKKAVECGASVDASSASSLISTLLPCIPIPAAFPVLGCVKAAIEALDAVFDVNTSNSTNNQNLTANMAVPSLPLELIQPYQNLVVAEQTYEASIALSEEFFQGIDTIPGFLEALPFFGSKIILLDTIRVADMANSMNAIESYELTEIQLQQFFDRWNLSMTLWMNDILTDDQAGQDIIDFYTVTSLQNNIDEGVEYVESSGYDSFVDMLEDASVQTIEYLTPQANAVCASVTVQISQQVTMTREAFEGTLDIFNGHPTDLLDSLTVNIQITDENGTPSNGLFQIETTGLTNLTDVTGTGSIIAQNHGIAEFLFIPEIGAAPTVSKQYSFGGTISYFDPFVQLMVTLPLSPITLTVNPSPQLYMEYFLERNILGDDPLTETIEPIVPAQLAVMIDNHGYGPAVNVSISSAQPVITENESGLAINFSLIGSNLQGLPMSLGLNNISFGTVQPQSAKIGQWYFTSSLLGKFVAFETNVVHNNSFGNPELSLIQEVNLHELTKSIEAYGELADGINDFLVNDQADLHDNPDKIYFSQGQLTADVYQAESGHFEGNINPPTFSNTLQFTPSEEGWNYIQLDDPGDNEYEVTSVTRSDGQVIPLANAWLTFVTLPQFQPPVYENKFHFVDLFDGLQEVSYTITWSPKDTDVPEIVSITGIPASVSGVAITNFTVEFNKPINPETFTSDDMTLVFQGGSNLINSSVQISQLTATTYNVDVSSITTGNGFYFLTVQAAAVEDLNGINGTEGAQVGWTQYLSLPAVESYTGIEFDATVNNLDAIDLLFNIPIDPTSFTTEDLQILLNGEIFPSSLIITSQNEENRLFTISNLSPVTATDGSYQLVILLSGISTPDDIAGEGDQSISFKIDNSGPAIEEFYLSSTGGLDSQHNTFAWLKLNEVGYGLNSAAFDLIRNSETVNLTFNQVEYLPLEDIWKIGPFGMETFYEGDYTLSVDLSNTIDIIGNAGSESQSLSWSVNRSSSIEILNLQISPDLGFSDSDGITSSGAFNVLFDLNEDASSVVISQIDFGNVIPLKFSSNVASGLASIPLTLPTTGNTVIRVEAFDAMGNSSSIERSLFIDATALTASWTFNPNQTLTTQPVSIPLNFSARLLDEDAIHTALRIRKNNVLQSSDDLVVTKISNTEFSVSGFENVSSANGAFSLGVQLSGLHKYSSGISGAGIPATSWTIQSANTPPVANAGSDLTITTTGEYLLDASGSTDNENDVLTYTWIPPSFLNLTNANTVNASLIVTGQTQNGTYSIQLVVSDGTSSSSDIVQVQINLGDGEYDCPDLEANNGDPCTVSGQSGEYVDCECQAYDCNGVPGGSASFDDCGVCSGGTTGFVPNESCTDCEGVVNGDSHPGSICYNGDYVGIYNADCECITNLSENIAGNVTGLTECGSSDMTISIYNADFPELNNVFSTTIDENGNFTTPQFAPGTYSILIKVDGYLAKLFPDEIIENGINPLDISGLIGGDFNNSNSINVMDVSVMCAAFGSVVGEEAYNPSVDMNCDGVVNIYDISALNITFGMEGDQPPGQ